MQQIQVGKEKTRFKMDRNALTEQRRQTVIGLLKGMNIKKSSEGGFDKDDVYECMQQLCDLYEKSIEELENTYEGEIVSLKDKYQKYDDNNELYISLIMEAKKSSNDIINQAKDEVENILAEGKDAVAQQEQAIEQMRANMDAERTMLTDELNAAREAVEAEKAAMKAELEAEKEKVSALRSKYHQQINSMESEFMEIKTNILRTAGKIDSIKSKLSDEGEVAWDVIDDNGNIDFPSEDIHVEENIPYSGGLTMFESGQAAEPAQEFSAAPEAETVPEFESMPSEGIFTDPKIDSFEEPVQEPAMSPADSFAPIPEDPAFTADNTVQVAENEAEYAEPEEISLEDLMSDIEIDLPDFDVSAPAPADTMIFDGSVSVPADTMEFGQTAAPAETLQFDPITLQQEQAAEPAPTDGQVEEISFEGLEELFKDEEPGR